jgi:dihydroflavonol-4-reductase
VDVVKRVLSAKDPAMPQLAFPVVDVRDVATMHVAAIDRPATFGQRYIASGGVVSFVQLAQILKSAFPTRKVVTRQAPNWAITCLGLFDRQIRAIIPMLGKQMSFDTRAAQRDLGVSFRDPAASIVETAEFLIAEK